MPLYPEGKEVVIHFEGRLIDGDVFESTLDKEPLRICLGNDEILEKLEATIQTMPKGATRTIRMTPEEGYGEYREDRIITISRELMPPIGTIKSGQELVLRTPEGEELPGIILDIQDDSITIDANHPLAGEELEFTITLVEVLDSDAEEPKSEGELGLAE